ncbi:TetR/AcrR family transcriptional regulator [Rhodococcus pyridinivorans]|uniref:TetR/AcrR family transcriptional regulator n=1 Tax=Rhodococcus pyridinivorans TaxID=103816 RepID=UPI00265A5A1E|nr:TetR family transcriptional regulator C-terminal domain-containing protein [Rhodococcus pyridinivorans]
MPKIVDHAQRHNRIGAAACVVLDREGHQGLSVRAVAREAGMALATAQHYAPTREAMMNAAMDSLEQRVIARAREIDPEVPHLDTVRAALLELLPLDDDRRFECRVWLALTAAAMTEPSVARRLESSESQLLANLERLVAQAHPAADRVAAAGSLTTVTTGLTVRMLTTGLSDTAAREEIDHALKRWVAEGDRRG